MLNQGREGGQIANALIDGAIIAVSWPRADEQIHAQRSAHTVKAFASKFLRNTCNSVARLIFGRNGTAPTTSIRP
jgi:hypothetical protein